MINCSIILFIFNNITKINKQKDPGRCTEKNFRGSGIASTGSVAYNTKHNFPPPTEPEILRWFYEMTENAKWGQYFRFRQSKL